MKEKKSSKVTINYKIQTEGIQEMNKTISGFGLGLDEMWAGCSVTFTTDTDPNQEYINEVRQLLEEKLNDDKVKFEIVDVVVL